MSSLSHVLITERDEEGKIKGTYVVNPDGTFEDNTSTRIHVLS